MRRALIACAFAVAACPALAEDDIVLRRMGSVDTIDLPGIGIKGNTHMMMMDKNSDQVAGVIQKWLVDKGLVD